MNRLVPLLLALLTGCSCLDELALRPELTASDLAKARAGAAAVEVSWKFKSCCPSAEQVDIALALQRNVARLWDRVVHEQISLDRYNELVRAAHRALTEVILVCSAEQGSAAVQQAWQQCDAVARRAAAADR